MMQHNTFILPIPGTNYKVVERFFQRLGILQTTVDNITNKTIVTIPGVSTAGFTMQFLRQSGLDSVINRHFENNGKIFGICSGMQVLFESSDENDYVQCLGIIPGKVSKIQSDKHKVPNLGWDDIGDEKYYFMHSYGVNINSTNANFDSITMTSKFPQIIASGKIANISFSQFHPEKSSSYGADFVERNFLCE